MRIESPTAFSAALVDGQAAPRPQPVSLGEVDPERRTPRPARRRGSRRTPRSPARRRASRVRWGTPASGAGGPGRRTSRPSPDGEHGERRRRASPAVSRTAVRSPRPGRRRRPGGCRAGTARGSRPARRRWRGRPARSTVGHAATLVTERKREAPGDRRGLAVAGRRRQPGARSPSVTVGGSRSLPVSSWTLTAISRSFSPCSRAWWAQKRSSPPAASAPGGRPGRRNGRSGRSRSKGWVQRQWSRSAFLPVVRCWTNGRPRLVPRSCSHRTQQSNHGGCFPLLRMFSG